MVRDFLEQVAREGLVIRHPGLPHQGRVGRKTLDMRKFRHLKNAIKIGAISEDLYLKVVYATHMRSPVVWHRAQNDIRRFRERTHCKVRGCGFEFAYIVEIDKDSLA